MNIDKEAMEKIETWLEDFAASKYELDIPMVRCKVAKMILDDIGYRKLPDKPPPLLRYNQKWMPIAELLRLYPHGQSPSYMEIANIIAQAQWDVCRKHYEP